MSQLIEPFTVDIPEAELEALLQRLQHTRWPERETTDSWEQGVPLAYARELAAHWSSQYDWRRFETLLNSWPQYTTDMDGIDIHFIHRRSPEANALPLILSHGWPSSITEFRKVIDVLADPVAHGGKAEDAFHVVVPSLPGYGFSGKPETQAPRSKKSAACGGS